ncbi:MAG: FAD-dependent oxidoreductase [Candidatus Kaiserbacteria bacterium]|nr:FAD-dependent oxidoreductase [Candidatus Kaiserbacteria bacterium]
MSTITIVGAGVQGTRMAEKYLAFPQVSLRAVISPYQPTSGTLKNIPFFTSTAAWKKKFGRANKNDVFDLCVHQNVLLRVLTECIRIGGKNFILHKPIALTKKELDCIDALIARYKLKVVVASQWHSAVLVRDIKKFVEKNKKNISSVEIVCSRPVEPVRMNKYNALTMFLPHMLQIAMDIGSITNHSRPHIAVSTREKISLHYAGAYKVRLETDLAAVEKTETIQIYLNGKKHPALIADLIGVRDAKGFYTSLTVCGKKQRIHEDVLGAMLAHTLPYFDGSDSKDTLTFKRYYPVAQSLLTVIQSAQRSITVIGGGIFGVLSALEIARCGYPVTIFEKEPDIILGASLVNQCRVHMGYHYPRDARTAKQSLSANASFKKMFRDAIVKHLNNYYLVAKEGSRTTAQDYLSFCKKMKLPHRHEWPKRTNITKEKIALSLRVPELIFDANRIRRILTKKLSQMPNVTLMTSTSVTGIARQQDGIFNVQYKSGGETRTLESGAIVNTTYGGLNHIHRLAGIKAHEYQYELCEMPVAQTPWRGTGWSIIDGPFFGVMPFGFSDEYLLYDVELSVLERSVGIVPQFAFTVAYYDTPMRRAKRFEAYKKKWYPYAPEIQQCKHLRSLYVIRTVLPKKEKTDARPTLIEQRAPGFWSIFSGKVTTSVIVSAGIAHAIDTYFKHK